MLNGVEYENSFLTSTLDTNVLWSGYLQFIQIKLQSYSLLHLILRATIDFCITYCAHAVLQIRRGKRDNIQIIFHLLF